MGDFSQAGSVAVIAAMVPEVRPVVRALSLEPVGGREEHVWAGPAGSRRVVAAVTSIGTASATEVTRKLLDAFEVDWVIAIGICGGIDPALAIGQLVVPASTVVEATGAEARPTPLPGHEPAGRLLTTDELHNDPDEVAALHAQGFVAVDMETGAIGLECEARSVPWSVLRAVSDRAGDPGVDPEVVGMAKPDGTADVSAVARYVLRHPNRLPKMAELGRGMKRAVAASTAATLDALRG
jgi:adenosylhomocysteine nucleosidase